MRRYALNLFFIALFSASCSSPQVRTKDSNDFSPKDETSLSAGSSESLSFPAEVTPKISPITLVLGPGLAKGYAHIGVLRAFAKNKIPIGAIVGVEMGALVGGAYASTKSMNQFEWLVFKVREDLFKDSGVNLSRLFGASTSGDRLNQTLTQIFGETRIEDLRIPFRSEVTLVGTSETTSMDSGFVSLSVRAALAIPGFIRPLDMGDKKLESSAALRPFPVETAKILSVGPVVVVDLVQNGVSRVSGEQTTEETRYQNYIRQNLNQAYAELEQADFVLRPDLSAIGYWDFSKKNSAMFAGEKCVQNNLKDIKNLAGMDTQP